MLKGGRARTKAGKRNAEEELGDFEDAAPARQRERMRARARTIDSLQVYIT